jgi:hypothetical protein
MRITIAGDKPEDIRDELVRWLDNAADAERAFGNVMSGKRHKERCEYAAEAINRLARSIADMEVKLN